MKRRAYLFHCLIGALLVALVSLAACHPSKPVANGCDKWAERVQLGGEQCDIVLNRFEGEIDQLKMLNHDVVTNVDAIINIQECCSGIIKAVEQNNQALTESQLQRYNDLRDEYRRVTGD